LARPAQNGQRRGTPKCYFTFGRDLLF